jgi:hypothetical protein
VRFQASAPAFPPRFLARAVCALVLLGGPASGFNAGLGGAAKDVERSSPFASVEGFLSEARRGHFAVAAQYFWLDEVPQKEQAAVGERVARRLKRVLDRHPIDLASLSKESEGGPGSVVAAVLEVEGASLPLRLVRLRDADSVNWLFSRETVRALVALDEGYDAPFGARLPHFFLDSWLGLELWQWLGLLLVTGGRCS